MVTMHADEADIDATLVRRLLRAQFPHWAHLPISRLPSGGTVNAMYRLGDELVVRLPLTSGGVSDLDRETWWLPKFAELLPVTIPDPVATGQPAEGYPWRWTVLHWIDGEVPVEGGLPDPELLAGDLGEFVTAMRKVDYSGGPVAHRGGPLAELDQEVHAALEALRHTGEPFDIDRLTAAWRESLAAPPWSGAPCWVHSDLMPSNLLTSGGRLAAVLDFGTLGTGDPACDLIPAWNLLPSACRQVFRDAVDVDDATWLRGRGWALAMAVIQLPYYRSTNEIIAANARYVLREVLNGSSGFP